MSREIEEKAFRIRLAGIDLRGLSKVQLSSARIHGWVRGPCKESEPRTERFLAAADIWYVTHAQDRRKKGNR